MSFKCSVFGHRYGDPEVDREREEQGSEVVITITETETCERCGETRVVSENKEVTSLETPADIVGDDIADESTGADEGEPAPSETPGDDAEVLDGTDDGGQAPPEPADVDTATGGADPAPTEWPDDDAEDDAVILDDDSGDGEDDDERVLGEWPDDGDDDGDDWAPDTDTDTELPDVEDEQPDVEPTASAVTVPEGEFYCPNCEFTTDVEESSLREGDFCPECHRGSLGHRPDEA